jgi:hypothetical protein
MKKIMLTLFSAALLCLNFAGNAQASDQLKKFKNESLDYWSNFISETESYCQNNTINNNNLKQLCVQIPQQKASFYQRRLEQATCLNQLILAVRQIKNLESEFANAVKQN